jgi:hypothetical protein
MDSADLPMERVGARLHGRFEAGAARERSLCKDQRIGVSEKKAPPSRGGSAKRGLSPESAQPPRRLR